jgi:exonuclease SbcC
MIPVRLNIRTFMCYSEVHEPLVFDGVDVACLSGQYGHGKSGLVAAMTWALWGKSGARTVGELVHLGPGFSEMEVEFEFRLGGDQYRVIRKHNKRGQGRSVLQLDVRDNGNYRTLTGNSVPDTERQIEQLLRMSYETFTNSSFILQGKADSFTTRTPAERKQILAEILDLSYYDRLEDRARRLAAVRGEQQATLRQQIQDDDLELQQQPELREQQQRLEAELAGLDERLQLTQARSDALRERLNRLQAAERELQEQERRLDEARARADRQREAVARAEAALEQARKSIERGPEIEAGYADLLERRAELERLAALQAEYNRLCHDLTLWERTVAEAHGQLEGRRQQLRGQLDGIEGGAARLEQCRAELATAHAEHAELEKLDQQRARLEAEIADARERYAALKAHSEQQQHRLLELGQKQDLLGESPTCPVCRTALGAERHRNVLAQYRKEAEQAADLTRKHERELRQVGQLGKSLRARLAELDTLPERRKVNRERLAQAERAVARFQEQATALDKLRGELERVETELEAASYAPQAQDELKAVQRQMASLSYDPDQHQRVSAAVAELSGYESLRHELLEARRSLAREQEVKAGAERELADWEALARAAEQRRTELLVETADLPTVRAEFDAVEAELRELRRQQVGLNQELGGVHQRLSTMEFIARRRAERWAEHDRVGREKSIYQDLAQAFGKKGLQVMLIETAIPEIQDEANRLLDLMTDGRMRVSFETQREAKSGDTVETLDINISDELGTRAYEMYSGGEAFRVNLAIRIALSKLLAHRAGASLQTLVIDEGFGSQDEQGIDRLVEAIKAIQGEFEKILIITHLADLRDLFPVRIEVTKTAAGSVIEVS